MIVVNRFRVGPDGPSDAGGAGEADGAGGAAGAAAEEFRAGIERARAALAERPGYVGGTIGRNVDDPSLWVLTTRWRNVGSYRRALSAYDVKIAAVPLLSRAIDEPSAYETVGEDAAAPMNVAVPRTPGGPQPD